jgi:RNA polymerase-binding transcription factor DksA
MRSRSEVLVHTRESAVPHPTVAEEASIGVESKEDERGGRGGVRSWCGFVKDALQVAEQSGPPLSHEDRVGLDLETVAQRLRKERAEVSARLATMTKDLESVFAASLDSNADDEHDPEGHTIAYERSQLSALIRAAQQHLSGIESATGRLEQGGYGTCEVCIQPIPAARLEARPTARTCVQHAPIDRG